MTFTPEGDKINTIDEFLNVVRARKIRVVTVIGRLYIYGQSGGNFSLFFSFCTCLFWKDLEIKEGEKFIDIVNSFEDYIRTLVTEPKKYSSIMERNGLQFFINKYNIRQHLPPIEVDSNFKIAIHGVIMEKGFVYESFINRM